MHAHVLPVCVLSLSMHAPVLLVCVLSLSKHACAAFDRLTAPYVLGL
jgi:hypothetical protein